MYKAQDNKGNTVAIKMLCKLDDERTQKTYENEIFALKKLEGVKGVIQMLDYGEALYRGKKTKYIVFEFIDG